VPSPTSDAANEPSTAATLIDGLLAAGEPVDEGSFSVDMAAAAAKLDAFQFGDRSAYLVPIAEAAAGLKPTQIQIETVGEDLVLTLPGVSLADPLRFLADPWSRTRGDPQDRRGRAWARLGVGLSMAVGHDSIKRIVVSHASADEILTAEYRHGQPPRLSRMPGEGPQQLRIIVDRPWTDRLRLRGPCHAELAHLRAAVAHASADFMLDGKRISCQGRMWNGGVVGRGSGPGYRWLAGLTDPHQPGRIELRVEHVLVETLPREGPGFVAVIDLDAPTRDLSQLSIIHDATLTAALAEVEVVRRRVVGSLDWSWKFAAALGGGGVKRITDGLPGLLFLGFTGVFTAFGFGLLFHGLLEGIGAVLFTLPMQGVGAWIFAKSWIDNEHDPRARTRVTLMLVAVAWIVALVAGYIGERIIGAE